MLQQKASARWEVQPLTFTRRRLVDSVGTINVRFTIHIQNWLLIALAATGLARACKPKNQQAATDYG